MKPENYKIMGAPILEGRAFKKIGTWYTEMGGVCVPNTNIYQNFSWDDLLLSRAIILDFSVVQTDFQLPWATGRVLVFIPGVSP